MILSYYFLFLAILSIRFINLNYKHNLCIFNAIEFCFALCIFDFAYNFKIKNFIYIRLFKIKLVQKYDVEAQIASCEEKIVVKAFASKLRGGYNNCYQKSSKGNVKLLISIMYHNVLVSSEYYDCR